MICRYPKCSVLPMFDMASIFLGSTMVISLSNCHKHFYEEQHHLYAFKIK